MNAAGIDLVVASLEPWDDVWRRNQHLVAGLLSAGAVGRVLFVEPASDLLDDARAGRRPRPGAGVRPEPTGVAPGRLWLYQPTKLVPRVLDPRFDARRARSVRRVARRLGMRAPVCWVNDPSFAPLLDTGAPRVVYDVTDDWRAASLPPRAHARVRADEEALLARASAVTVCSPHLARVKGDRAPVVLITNGVDVARYRRPAPRPADLPAGPVALYAGTLHADRLDVALTAATARALRGTGRLVLLGPDALGPADRAALEGAGVVLLGARPSAQVPAYLQHADALVVPHVVSAFTESLDPLKLYEYLAVGRHVVSTPVAGFRDAPVERVTCVGEGFADAVVAAVRTSAAPLEPPADLPSWERQCGLMAQVLNG